MVRRLWASYCDLDLAVLVERYVDPLALWQLAGEMMDYRNIACMSISPYGRRLPWRSRYLAEFVDYSKSILLSDAWQD